MVLIPPRWRATGCKPIRNCGRIPEISRGPYKPRQPALDSKLNRVKELTMFHYIAANWLQILLSTGLACYVLNFVWTTQLWEVKYQKQRHGDAVKYEQQRHEDAGVDQKLARRRSNSPRPRQ